jgi:hypothetical protein
MPFLRAVKTVITHYISEAMREERRVGTTRKQRRDAKHYKRYKKERK